MGPWNVHDLRSSMGVVRWITTLLFASVILFADIPASAGSKSGNARLNLLRVRPILECVYENPDGSYTAHFGYENKNPYPVTIPVGPHNMFFAGPADRGQPIVLQSGRTPKGEGGFTVRFEAPHWRYRSPGVGGRSRVERFACPEMRAPRPGGYSQDWTGLWRAHKRCSHGFLVWKLGHHIAWAWAHSKQCHAMPATPDAQDDAATTGKGAPVTIDVLENDIDPQGDPLTIERVTAPRRGSVTTNPDSSVTYTPRTAFVGTDRFTYVVSDGKGGTDEAAVTVTVAGETPTLDLNEARSRHTATLLSSGRVLFTGGLGSGGEPLSTSEILDPTTRTVTPTSSSLVAARQDHAASLLPLNAIALLAGAESAVSTSSAELYDPAEDTFELLSATLAHPRAGHTATVLLDGRVLILGGLDEMGDLLGETEAFDATPDPFSGGIFDPRAGTFTPLPQALVVPRWNHTATLLPNGLVLVMGGQAGDVDLDSVELVDPQSGQSALLAAKLNVARHGHTATLRPDESVLVAGGESASQILASVERFDPLAQAFVSTSDVLAVPRAEHTATLLPSGAILFAGGADASGVLSSTEVLEPQTGDSTPPQIVASLPIEGAADVVLNSIIGLRLSEPVNATTVTGATVRLSGPDGLVAGVVGIAEGGLYIFFVPDAPLTPGGTFTLFLDGVLDLAGNALAPTSISFSTGVLPEITGIAPTHGVAGTAVSISGSGFDPSIERNRVFFGSTLASVTAASRTLLTTIVPASLPAGPTSITIETPAGCATSPEPFVVENPVPTLESLAPDTAQAGSPELTLVLSGSGFVADSMVSWAGTAIPTTLVGPAELTAQVSASFLATSGSFPISVTNSLPGGGTSNELTFMVTTGVVSIAIAPMRVNLFQGEQRRLFVTAMRSDGTAENVTARVIWANSNAGVASCSSGLVEGKAEGTTMITAILDGLAAQASVAVEALESIPPDPSTVAPLLDLTVASTIDMIGEFLYTGENPIQRGMTTGTIEFHRAAILRGRVMDAAGLPLPGVRVTVLGHPEYGRTLTRADGMFDLMVNGGGVLTLNYEKPGLLTLQRNVEAPWQDFSFAPDVVMIPYDARVTEINLTAGSVQAARGSLVVDGDGARQATVLFLPGAHAVAEYPDGSTQEIAILHARATEFTVGERGPQRMPAELPSSSAYTYALELSADEGRDAARVSLSRPARLYLENFLDITDGVGVPLGYYDRRKGAWQPLEDGAVIRILGVEGGLAMLDINGDGVCDENDDLGFFDITDAERAQLAALYSPGQSLWRMMIPHFSAYDPNYGVGEPDDAEPPPGEEPQNEDDEEDDEDEDEDCCETGTCEAGSIIGCQNGSLMKRFEVTGTPFSLSYRSDRTAARANRGLVVTLSGLSVPASLEQIEADVYVAGRRYSRSYSPAAGMKDVFRWDGRDAYGRAVQGEQPVSVRTTYTYPAVYYGPALAARAESFGRRLAGTGAGAYISFNARDEAKVAVYRNFRATLDGQGARLGAWDAAKAERLGGLTLDVHHSYDLRNRTLYKGDGSRSSPRVWPAVVPTIGGTGTSGSGGDGGPATQAEFNYPSALAFGPDGSLYVADRYNHRIRKISRAGIIDTIAGTGNCAYTGDGGHAAQASLCQPDGVAVDSQGNIYIADTNNSVIRKVDLSGIISTIAGNGGFCGGEGQWNCVPGEGSALERSVTYPTSLVVNPEGGLLFSQEGTTRGVWQLTPHGMLVKLPYDPSWQWDFDFAAGPDGSLYLSETYSYRIVRLRPDGRQEVVAGNGTYGYSGDGGPAIQAQISPGAIAVGHDGSFYFVDGGARVRRVYPNGRIITVAGRDVYEFGGENAPARAATFSSIAAIAISPEGEIYVASGDERVRAIRPAMPGFAGIKNDQIVIPSSDGSEAYSFDQWGRHVAIYNAVTGDTIHQFNYGYQEYGVVDAYGNRTTVRQHNGTITAPGEQVTTVALDGNGGLSAISNPAQETTMVQTSASGLIESITDPRGGSYDLSYTNTGRLLRSSDPAGGFKELARAGGTSTVTTALGRSRSYNLERLPTQDRQRTLMNAAGLVTNVSIRMDGASTSMRPDGNVLTRIKGPSPIWGMQSPLVASRSITTPDGLAFNMTRSRSVSLSDPQNPLSLQKLTDTFNLNGCAFTRTYDAAMRKWKTRTPLGRERTFIFNDRGRLTELRIPGIAPTTFGYDSRGRLVSAIQGTRSMGIQYDDQNRPVRLFDSLLRETSFAYDAASRATSISLPGNRVVGFEYDQNGNTTGVTPPGKPTHSFSYTGVDLTASYTPPALGGIPSAPTNYGWTLDRDSDSVTRSDGRQITYGYDSAGRISTVSTPEGVFNRTYDVAGRIFEMQDPEGNRMEFGYDGDLLLSTTWTGEIEGSVSRAYDNDFRIASESVNGGHTVTYAYDDDGLLVRAGDLTISRNTINNLVTGTQLGQVNDAYEYDQYGEVSRYTARFGTDVLFDVQYTRDDLGRLTALVETVQGVTQSFDYAYDDAGRLASVTRDYTAITSYTYDANGNRLFAATQSGSFVATYNERDQMLTYGDTSYTYSPDGELLRSSAASGDTTYSFDVHGALRAVTLPNGGQIEFVLDSAGLRIGKRVNGTVVQRRIYGQALEVLAVLDASGNVEARYVFMNRFGSAAYMTKGDRTYRILSDHLGSARLVVDVSTGEIAQALNYNEWGSIILDTNPGFQPFAFTGREWDPEIGLYYYRARYYDPKVGRFISEDPIGFAGEIDFYVYADNRPNRLVDPFGLDVANNSSGTVYVKPGDSSVPVAVPPGGEYIGDQDGLAVPDARKEEVYKTVDNIDATVEDDGSVEWSGGSMKEKIGQMVKGGWKDEDWLKDIHEKEPPDHGWDDLFEKAGVKPPCKKK